jgi:hypothetical protein
VGRLVVFVLLFGLFGTGILAFIGSDIRSWRRPRTG